MNDPGFSSDHILETYVFLNSLDWQSPLPEGEEEGGSSYEEDENNDDN